MADTFTANYNLTKPQIGGDSNTWGGLLNTNMDTIDATIKAVSNVANAALPAASHPIGLICLWYGDTTNVPPKWRLCNGLNGTPDMRDKFVVAAGLSYPAYSQGGVAVYALSWNQMPVHNHGVNDPGHAHAVYDPGHTHYVNDPGHAHNYDVPPPAGDQADARGANAGASWLDLTGYGLRTSWAAVTGIWLNASATSIGIYGSGTGVSTQNAGAGAAIENRPPYLAMCYIMFTNT